MAVVSGLTRDDPSTIGFVVGCLFCEAIDLNDLREWALHVVVENEVDDVPEYILNLTDPVDSRAHVVNVIGFSAGGNRVREMEACLYGIAYLRGVDVFDPPVSRASAEEALLACPDVMREFRSTFPFISI
ncbi:hypothetical protein [Nocardia fluminea]|uniref:hypothetical protein n=1 Tax=Nocardia fluminea TaxID=134984 RepID=UPI003661B18E